MGFYHLVGLEGGGGGVMAPTGGGCQLKLFMPNEDSSEVNGQQILLYNETFRKRATDGRLK